MEEKESKQYLEAAQIAASVRASAEDAVKPGAKLLDVAKEIEAETLGAGGKLAFPVNISLNEVAAHYTPPPGDETTFEDQVAKIDFGVHVEGCIVDQAFTADLGKENGALVEASREALEAALATMKAGVCVSDVGKAIQQAIEARGFKPVENLCGHSLEPYLLHAGNEVPNVEKGSYVLEEGDVFAVEPFATTGGGKIKESTAGKPQIYSLANPKPVRLPQSRRLLDYVLEERKTLPFCRRWPLELFPSESSLDLALRDLVRQEVLKEYPLLVEINDGLVSQAEGTVVIEKDGVKRLA